MPVAGELDWAGVLGELQRVLYPQLNRSALVNLSETCRQLRPERAAWEAALASTYTGLRLDSMLGAPHGLRVDRAQGVLPLPDKHGRLRYAAVMNTFDDAVEMVDLENQQHVHRYESTSDGQTWEGPGGSCTWGRRLFIFIIHVEQVGPDRDRWAVVREFTWLPPDESAEPHAGSGVWGGNNTSASPQLVFTGRMTPAGLIKGAPQGIAVHEGQGELLVADACSSSYHRLLRFQLLADGVPTLRFIGSVGSPGSGPKCFKFPRAIAITHTGHVLVADESNGRIQVLGYSSDNQLNFQHSISIPSSGPNGPFTMAFHPRSRLLFAAAQDKPVYSTRILECSNERFALAQWSENAMATECHGVPTCALARACGGYSTSEWEDATFYWLCVDEDCVFMVICGDEDLVEYPLLIARVE